MAAAAAPGALRYLQVVDPNVATAAEMLFHSMNNSLCWENTSGEPFESESLTLQTTRVTSLSSRVQCSGLFLLCRPIFSWQLQKQTADCGPYRRGEDR